MPDDRVMLITGTSKGIGRYLAEYYANKGCHVIGCSRTEINYRLDQYQHFCLDVCDERAVKKMFTDIRKQFKRLDVLINNAGVASMNHALLTTVESVQKILNTNVVGTFLLCREAAKIMKTGKGCRIINFSTVATPLKLAGEAIYSSSKAAVENLTQVLAKEFAEFGITVNAIGPTPIKTDLIRSIPEEKIERLLDRQYIRRLGEFEDVSNVINFFLSEESGYITGQVIYLGGVIT